MSHIDETKEMARKRKIVSHVYAFADMIIAFFAVWTFAAMLKIVVSFSKIENWLAKSAIQQWPFMGIAIILFLLVIGGPQIYEKAMRRYNTWVPRSFVIITAVMLIVYGVSKIIIVTY